MVVAVTGLLFSQQGKKAQPKKQAKPVPVVVQQEEELGPGEVACGIGVKNAHPCECMKHRIKVQDEEQLKCMLLPDKHERAMCSMSHEACNVRVTDYDHREYGADGEAMPAQCSRSCSKAKCRCCTS